MSREEARKIAEYLGEKYARLFIPPVGLEAFGLAESACANWFEKQILEYLSKTKTT